METTVAAPPEAVFEVLADPYAYGDWIVGSREVQRADPDWPAPGSRFHHSLGIGPLHVSDETCVEACEPPRLLRLRARARPLGTAVVTLELEPAGGGTRVTMVEDGGDLLTRLALLPTLHLPLRIRNAGSLGRLRALAERSGA